MKVIRKDSLMRRNQRVHTKEERKIMENLNSPFIVQLYYAFQTAEKLYMVMDFMVGGMIPNILSQIRRAFLSFEERRKIY
jgi:serine/threonine protein kinase